MAYQLLYHNELDIKSVEKNYFKTVHQLQQGDFKSADVRKMPNTGYYRARLDLRGRLLFTIVQYKGSTYLLLLEIIKDHNYAQSRFLRGALLPEEDQLIAVPDSTDIVQVNNPELSFLNPESRSVHLLNKFISFDEIQEKILLLQTPLIIIGAAGSGKTALVLSKLKNLTGNVAYISLSKFLVENASRIYYSNGYDNEHQEVEFLSLNDYLSSWEKPVAREIHFRAFEPWFTRYAQTLKISEPYRVYEEFKGVITGSPTDKAWLSQEEYLALGVKQSIFSMAEREKLYPLFEKYVQWMKENNWYDSNIICYEYLEKIKPRYDYILVDEVQDITNIQLKCILQSLIAKTNFVLTGDSNQIVHPNFFSWSKVKTFFYQSGDAGKQVNILQTNYRNSRQVVKLSNHLLKIKNKRFGSIDRESNYLLSTVSQEDGEVLLYRDEDKTKNELNRLTQENTNYAVIVTENIYKDEARRFFKTPLVFSIHEAKGLEYENVILVNFVSRHETEFLEIIRGVSQDDLVKDEFQYNRSANKEDKEAEIYKFYINSLYVAITRAVKNIYFFEKLVTHPALQLLEIGESKKEIKVNQLKSSREEWLEEARRLEEQGKYEQAEQIRAKYLGYEYISAEELELILQVALNPSLPEQDVKKQRKQLFQYSIHHQRYDWIEQLAKLQFQRAILYMKEVKQYRKEFAKNIRLGRNHEVISILKKYGYGFVTEEGSTGLMLALHHGQNELVREFIKQNVSIKQTDQNGWLALDYLLDGYYKNILFNHNQMATTNTLRQFWHLVKPPEFVVELENQQIHINGHSMLFFLIIAMRIMESQQPIKVKIKIAEPDKEFLIKGGFDMDSLQELTAIIPDVVLPTYRKNRSYINSVLASNEISRQGNAGCKMLFIRVKRGVYIINYKLKWL
jgi:hypothetical protein